jgi:beta-galactosidase
LEISSSLAKDEIWTKAGHEVSWDQFELKSWNIPAKAGPAVKRNINLTQGADGIVVSGQGFSYRFNAQSGALESMNIDGKELLKEPVTLNVWRAPVANEIDGWNGSGAGQPAIQGYAGIGANTVLASHYYSASLDKRSQANVSIKTIKGADVVVVDVKDKSLSTNGSDNRFENDWHWTVYSDGTITVHHKVSPMGKMPQWLPRIGVSMSLDKSLSKVEWYGRGPQASYPDRKSGYRVGIYKTTVNDMYEPYLIPQDYGLRTDNRWVRLTDNSGNGLEFSMDQFFNFNAYDCTTDNLTKAIYQYQLQRGGDITLNLDYATSGVGCTCQGIFRQYRVMPEPYQRTIHIKPLRGN